MATIDDIGRRAGRAARDEAARLDPDAELARLRDRAADEDAGVETPGSPAGGRRRVIAVAAAVAIVAAAAVVVAIALGRGDDGVVTEDPSIDREPTLPEPTVPDTPEPSPDTPVPERQDRSGPVTVDVFPIDLRSLPGVPAPVSPDGRWVAHEGPDRALCLVALAGQASPGCQQIEGLGFGQLSWSPDSARLTGGDDARFGQPTRTLVVDVDGTWTHVDLDVEGPLIVASFAGDGASIVGVLPPDEEAGVPFRLAVVDVETGSTRVLADYPGPLDGSTPPPLPIDPDRSVLFGSHGDVRPEEVIRYDTSMFVLDHSNGTLSSIASPDEWPRRALDVTTGGDPVVLAGAGQIRVLPSGREALTYFAALELWDVDAGTTLPLPVAPDTIVPHGAAISPDGSHLAVAWTAGDALQLGTVAIDDVTPAEDGTWDWEPWSIVTLTEPHASERPVFEVCWCGGRIVVVTSTTVHAVNPSTAIADPPATFATPAAVRGDDVPSFVERLALIPDGYGFGIEVLLADLDVATELAGIERPDVGDDDAIVEWFTTITDGRSTTAPGIQALSTGPLWLGAAATPEDPDPSRQLGIGLPEVAWSAHSNRVPPFAVMGGRIDPERVRAAADDDDDGVARVGPTDWFEMDPERESQLSPFGAPIAVGVVDDAVVASPDPDPVRSIIDADANTATLADVEPLRVAADVLDRAGAYTGRLFSDPDNPSTLGQPLDAVATGLVVTDDGDHEVLVVIVDDEAVAAAERVVDRIERGNFSLTGEPWSDSFQVRAMLVVDDGVVAVRLVQRPEAPVPPLFTEELLYFPDP